MSCNAINENISVQFFHSSAVRLAKRDDILRGILPILIGDIHLDTLSSIISNSFCLIKPFSIHPFCSIHFAVPKNKLCIGSIIVN